MKIKYSHAAGITAEVPPGDGLARLASLSYAYALNTPDRVNVWHDGPQFAQAIRECCDMDCPQTAAIVAHLENLTP